MNARRLRSRVLVALSVLACGLVLWCVPALAARGHVFSGTFGEPCVVEPCGAGQFKEPSGVAVNEASGQVYVLDQGDSRIERFSLAGAYEAQFDGSETPAKTFAFGSVSLPAGIAVDNSCYFKKLSGGACAEADPSNGDVYVTDLENEVVDKFSEEGVYLGQLQDASGEAAFKFERGSEEGLGLDGVGVDASGTVWIFQGGGLSEGVVDRFTNAGQGNFIPSGEVTLPYASGFRKPGFAVDSKGNIYLRNSQEGRAVISKYDSSGNHLSSPFETEEASAVAVDLSSDEVFVDDGGSVGAFGASGSLEERIGSGILIAGSGLTVSHTNESVYVVDSATAMVDVFSPEPPSKPMVQAESVSDVTGNSATFGAEINPRGALTEYHFEYGPCATPSTCASSAYEESVPVPDLPVGSDFEVHSVSTHRQDLLAGTTYHFRVVAHNSFDNTEPVNGEELTFTTQTAGGRLVLPDGRAWEMVSPPDKHGALIRPPALDQASGAGDVTTYEARSPTEGDPQGYAKSVQVLSTRGPTGWLSKDIGTPHEKATGPAIGAGEEYRFFSKDLSFGMVQPRGSFIPASSSLALSPQEASEQTAFLRIDYLHGDVNDPCMESCYRPLVTGAPGYANVPVGTAFGEEGSCPASTASCGPVFAGASPDLTHVVLKSKAPLTSGANSGALYEWAGGRLVLVSVLPESEEPAPAPNLGTGVSDAARHAVSDDGSRVVWSESQGHLYVRDTVRRKTVQLDAPEPECLSKGTCGSGGVGPVFQAASSDGLRVFFTDAQHLTENSGGSSSDGPDLYECQIMEAAGKLQCRLSDLTPLGAGEAANMPGAVLGTSEDGSWVYFVANNVLAQGAVPGKCRAVSMGETTCNLYVWHDGTTRLVAILSNEDTGDWDPLDVQTARVSPDGRWLAFMSQRELTGYDTRDAVSGNQDEEVYLYDGSGAGRLVCASCNPTGARPLGMLNNDSLVADGFLPGRWLAANVPAWTSYESGKALYQSRYLSDSGRLFFDSNDALVPQDVNGREDVYEYEPPGVGGCTSASVAFSGRSGGCVGLVSSGASAEESVFIDASETGGDVFFATTARLASQDFDTAFDVYDAHECTSSSPCFPVAAAVPPVCTTTDSCRAAPSVQPSVFGSPSSATFSGAANVTPASTTPVVKAKTKPLSRVQKLARARKACHARKSKRKRKVCESQARKKYGSSAKSHKGGK
jgi:DNA-binding beta-propeller fold protein YncE